MKRVLACLALSISLLNCKPADSSQEKTLDDLASGSDAAVNQCQADPGKQQSPNLDLYLRTLVRVDGDVKLPAAEEQAYKAAVNDYVKALPSQVQDLLFESRTAIVLTNKASINCGFFFSHKDSEQYASDRGKITGCYNYVINEKNPQEARSLIMHQIKAGDQAKNIANIRHNGVRIVGMALAQFFLKQQANTTSSAANSPLMLTDVDILSQEKQQLTDAFLREAKDAAGSLQGLNGLKGVMGEKFIEQFLASKDSDSPLASWEQSHEFGGSFRVQRQRLLDFVLGEAFDSQHCSQKTRAVFASNGKFAETGKVFAGINAKMLEHIALLTPIFRKSNAGNVPGSAGLAFIPGLGASGFTQLLSSLMGSFQSNGGGGLASLASSDLTAGSCGGQFGACSCGGSCPSCSSCSGGSSCSCGSCSGGGGSCSCSGGSCSCAV